jgi:hypothetical protein
MILTLRFNIALMTLDSAWLYPFGKGGIRPFLHMQRFRRFWRTRGKNSPYKYTQFSMSLGFMEWRLQGAKLVNEAAQRPDIGLGIVGPFLHQLRRHIIWCLVS